VTDPLILVVEDDRSTSSSVSRSLAAHRYRVVEAPDGATARREWERRRPDLVILDLGLPDVDGLAILRSMRRDASTPVLVLTARGGERVKVAALDQGADDYVTKPFGMDELHARIRALLRRAAGPSADDAGVVTIGRLRVDVARHTVDVGSTPVRLTPREFEVLKVLVTHAGRLVTHGRLLRAVWGTAYSEEGHYLHVHVSQIRRKIAAADETGELRRLIVSEPGVGYRIATPDDASDAT
jgi:two-component system, OmpR family, KDP operon response regulator KdpE